MRRKLPVAGTERDVEESTHAVFEPLPEGLQVRVSSTPFT
jgi:hypothetical protein